MKAIQHFALPRNSAPRKSRRGARGRLSFSFPVPLEEWVSAGTQFLAPSVAATLCRRFCAAVYFTPGIQGQNLKVERVISPLSSRGGLGDPKRVPWPKDNAKQVLTK